MILCELISCDGVYDRNKIHCFEEAQARDVGVCDAIMLNCMLQKI